MKIGEHYKQDEILLRHFENLANENEISFTKPKKVVKNQCETLSNIIGSIINNFENEIKKNILPVVQQNCVELLKGI